MENSLYEKHDVLKPPKSFDDFKDVDKIYNLNRETCQTANNENAIQSIDRRQERRLSRDRGNVNAYNLDSSQENCDSIMKHQKPRRRKSRAGSEPPVSKTEQIADVIHDTRLRRSQSDIDIDRGDLMTRVELPRRSSFLNPGNKRRARNMKEGTPLGFTELFDEFRNQEGLTSVDDILAAIIGE